MKIGIITINDDNNYGNRLQNYASQEVLKAISQCNDVITIKNDNRLNYESSNVLKYNLKKLKCSMDKIILNLKKDYRKKCFYEFNKNIHFSQKTIYLDSKKENNIYDYFFVGSDQVWNPNGRMTDIDLLKFASNEKKNSFSASLAVDEISDQKQAKKLKENLITFKNISVREDKGKEIIQRLTGREDVEVIVDPTMLLTPVQWDKVASKPIQKKNNKKFILNYFLGRLSDERKSEIERIANENDCEIINLLDKNDVYYYTGPSEFLWLEKNAFLICTDSFHSAVFAILYDKPFIVFNREDKNKSMNSRLETLLNKFKLEDRYYKGKITDELLNIEYKDKNDILLEERKKANDFIKKCLDK